MRQLSTSAWEVNKTEKTFWVFWKSQSSSIGFCIRYCDKHLFTLNKHHFEKQTRILVGYPFKLNILRCTTRPRVICDRVRSFRFWKKKQISTKYIRAEKLPVLFIMKCASWQLEITAGAADLKFSIGESKFT